MPEELEIDDSIVDVILADIEALRQETDPEAWMERAEPIILTFEAVLVAYQVRECGIVGNPILIEGGRS